MAKTKGPPAADEHAVSFLGFARQYQKAANLVYAADDTLKIPIYFMYGHAIELALKAFLRAANLPIASDKNRKHHRIADLYKDCKAHGLKVGPDDVMDLGNVVVLLEGANEEQGLRYFRTKGSSYPDLAWTRDAVEKLIKAVEPAVEQRRVADGIVPGRAAKFYLGVATLERRVEKSGHKTKPRAASIRRA